MNSRTNTTNQDIINEITGIEYEDDDALTLLDDEEMQSSTQTVDDEDLNSFYLDYPTSTEMKNAVDLYTEEIVKQEEPKKIDVPIQPVKEVEQPQPVIVPTVAPSPVVPEVKEFKDNGYQNKLGQLSTNIDAYLNGTLDKKEEVKVEKMNSVVVPAASLNNPTPTPVSVVKETVMPTPVQPVVQPNTQPVTPATPNKNIDNNLNQLFAQASDNIRGAADVKRKMEERYKELERLYEEFEKKKKADYDEINAYKDEVYNKLKEKKEDLDEQAKKLKADQDTLANQKKQFEVEKQKIKDEAKKKEQEMMDAFKDREKNIEQVENGLIKRKEQLDLEKIKIAKERAQCEQEKKDLAENLVKFNQLVDDFTKGVDRFSENN